MNPRLPRIPKYRKHSSGQARVTLNGHDVLLGPYGTAESKAAYNRAVAEWLERQRQPAAGREGAAGPLSISEIILAYWSGVKEDARLSAGGATVGEEAATLAARFY